MADTPRRQILNEVLKKDKFPTSIKSNDVKSDQGLFHKMLKVISKNKEIGVSTEPDRGLIWFRRR
jgi:hypothetical protein